jgi:hypothetical protein
MSTASAFCPTTHTPIFFFSPAMSKAGDSGKRYHLQCTGLALETAEKHASDDSELTFFAACFCPFVQRVWVALEFLGIPYKVRHTPCCLLSSHLIRPNSIVSTHRRQLVALIEPSR